MVGFIVRTYTQGAFEQSLNHALTGNGYDRGIPIVASGTPILINTSTAVAIYVAPSKDGTFDVVFERNGGALASGGTAIRIPFTTHVLANAELTSINTDLQTFYTTP